MLSSSSTALRNERIRCTTADFAGVDVFSEFKRICNQLNSIGKPVLDQRKVFLLLTNLGSSYENFAPSMLEPQIKGLVPSVAVSSLKVTALLSHHRAVASSKVGQNQILDKGNQPPQDSVLQQHNAIDSTRSASSASHPIKCQICNKLGHGALKCFGPWLQAN
ncbi:hypothetical protein NE237_030758 [Protea cynaroides]|uniref:Uncharacterized protein n=1 Tax=Protea cynaroides TaxID=273540 RepID=A0A9Q0JW31_9MAGN|nr:hypothetical protein NE237_030758 [Protea cynaroides]